MERDEYLQPSTTSKLVMPQGEGLLKDGTVRINVWATPRSLGTALMYSFAQVCWILMPADPRGKIMRSSQRPHTIPLTGHAAAQTRRPSKPQTSGHLELCHNRFEIDWRPVALVMSPDIILVMF